MTTTKRAIIEWMSAEQGGRDNGPPFGPDYAAPAKFLAHAEKWHLEAWDLLVHKVECVGGQDKWLADVRFRVDEAPHEWLTPHADFELYEGKRCVARGRIGDNA
jgi:hypothetical protein